MRLSGLRDELTLVVVSLLALSLLELSLEELSFDEPSFDEPSFDELSGLDLSSFVESFESLPPSEVGAWDLRSEERRVGKECRSRWSPYH